MVLFNKLFPVDYIVLESPCYRENPIIIHTCTYIIAVRTLNLKLIDRCVQTTTIDNVLFLLLFGIDIAINNKYNNNNNNTMIKS